MLKRYLQNSSYLLSAQLIIKTVAFFYAIFVANSLGPENYGKFVLALSFFALISSFSDFGLSRYLIREMVKGKESEILSNVFFLRTVITALLVIIIGGILYIFDPQKDRTSLTLLALLAVIPQSINLTLDNILVSLQKFSYSALGLVITGITSTIFGVVLILNGLQSAAPILGLLCGQVITMIVLFKLIPNTYLTFTNLINIRTVKKVLLGSLPYGLLGLIGILYFRIDTLLLAYLKGPYQTGIYAAAYKFLEAIIFIPSILAITLFPLLVRIHTQEPRRIQEITHKIIMIMAAVGVLFTAIFYLVLPIFIQIFLPSYLPSIVAINVLSLSIPFMFIIVPLSQIMLASDKYLKPIIIISTLPLILNILLNWFLIPKYGYLAAAWITVLSDILSFLVLYLAIRMFVFKKS